MIIWYSAVMLWCCRSKEHCLMGIKGTVRRSTDGDFIHANVDIDLIIDEEPEVGSLDKPVEMFHIAEHFCLGRRRLHVFGRDSCLRCGEHVDDNDADYDGHDNDDDDAVSGEGSMLINMRLIMMV